MQTREIDTGRVKNNNFLNKETYQACLENNIKTNMMRLQKYPSKLLQFIKPRIKLKI